MPSYVPNDRIGTKLEESKGTVETTERNRAICIIVGCCWLNPMNAPSCPEMSSYESTGNALGQFVDASKTRLSLLRDRLEQGWHDSKSTASGKRTGVGGGKPGFQKPLFWDVIIGLEKSIRLSTIVHPRLHICRQIARICF